MKIEKIYCYPIKALRAVELDSVEVTKHGFPFDRRYMILHVEKEKDGSTKYTNVHVAHYPQSVLFFPSLDVAAGLLTITYKPGQDSPGEEKSIDIPLTPYVGDLESVDVTMHKSPTKAYKMGKSCNDWFSTCYGIDVILVHLGEHLRPVRMSSPQSQSTPNGNSNGSSWLSNITNTATSFLPSALVGNNPSQDAEITFADCAPYLIASQTSVEDIHPRLKGSKMDISKFRPNIIVSGAEKPWDEDFWGEITIAGNTKIDCVHNCGRCKSINISYETGAPGTDAQGDALKSLQKDRRVDPGMKYSPIFGRYSFLQEASEGNVVRVGDVVEVSKRNSERTVFGESSYHDLSMTALVLTVSRQIGLVCPLLRLRALLFSVACLRKVEKRYARGTKLVVNASVDVI